MPFAVVGCGQANIDYLGLVSHYPGPNRCVELEQFSIQGGGPVANALATLAVFGVDTAFVSKIADDEFGDFLRQGLHSFGVDCNGLIVEADQITPFSFVVVDKRSGSCTTFWTGGSINPIKVEEVPLGIFDEASLLLVDGRMPDVQLAVAQHAKGSGIPVTAGLGGGVDTPKSHESINALIAVADYLLVNEVFVSEFLQIGHLERGLEEFRKMGPRLVAITMGDEGAIGIDEDGVVHREKALSVDVVDRTGAADVWRGSFIYGVLNDWSLSKILRFCNATAALACRELGAWAGIPSLGDSLPLIAT